MGVVAGNRLGILFALPPARRASCHVRPPSPTHNCCNARIASLGTSCSVYMPIPIFVELSEAT